MEPMYHIRTTDQNVAPYVLLPGDPHRVPLVAAKWDTAEKVADNREHVTYTGTYKGMPITCTSTGMGCPSTAIAIEELARCGAKTLVRMGTGAAIQPEINVGDMLIIDSAYRADGTTKMYVPEGYPAVADHDIVEAMIQVAKNSGVPYHVGTSYCRDALYSNRANKNTSFGGYHPHDWDHFFEDLQQTKTMTQDMESAAVLVLSRLFGLRGGVILVNVVNFAFTGTKEKASDFSKDVHYTTDNVDRLCSMANEVMYQIYLNDQKALA